MIAYLDTNIVAWLSQNKLSRHSSEALRVLRGADLLISPIVLIEVEFLHEIRRTKLPARDVHLKFAHETSVRVCEMPLSPIAQIAVHESWTRDPFDRIIVANAKANGLAFLISADKEIARNYPWTVW